MDRGDCLAQMPARMVDCFPSFRPVQLIQRLFHSYRRKRLAFSLSVFLSSSSSHFLIQLFCLGEVPNRVFLLLAEGQYIALPFGTITTLDPPVYAIFQRWLCGVAKSVLFLLGGFYYEPVHSYAPTSDTRGRFSRCPFRCLLLMNSPSTSSLLFFSVDPPNFFSSLVPVSSSMQLGGYWGQLSWRGVFFPCFFFPYESSLPCPPRSCLLRFFCFFCGGDQVVMSRSWSPFSLRVFCQTGPPDQILPSAFPGEEIVGAS